ncbi:MAG: valine--tRNA ligase [Anaerolineae bacterium]|nr:valine--tRNA ligase [Anaerolineae bacterium]
MGLSKRYNPKTREPEIDAFWQDTGVYAFSKESDAPVYAIDTPPATVSGKLHLGHTYSYSQTDFLARFWRMNGYNVFYPMGYDDNGLPTGRLVEKLHGVTADQVGREAFVKLCLQVGAQSGQEYQALWQRLGLSVDWRYTYRTIEPDTTRISQQSFLDLVGKGLAYHKQSPTIWCPECKTAIAQAELDDLDRQSTFYTLDFGLENGDSLPIATTRPELLPACVAVFVHPDDTRYHGLVGQRVRVPVFGQSVPLLQDPHADPEKGTGAVMCCTFGDVTDVAWWHTHNLPLIEAIAPDGTMTEAAGVFAHLSIARARQQIVQALDEDKCLLERQPIEQSVRVHERCDTPVEYIVTRQWFIRVLDFKEQLLDAGERIAWHPEHMRSRYRQWVENLGWDWCISRQRAFGVPFPAWHCQDCGQVVLAKETQLPIDPAQHAPPQACACGSARLVPDTDVMDTWATSSLSPQIAGRWLQDPGLYEQVTPMSLRPQAHDIIRTWAFYTIVKSLHHFGTIPWKDVAISGWGIAGPGMAKISKSRGGGPVPPLEMIEQYSADAVRYWAASTGLGKDAVISEEKIQLGHKLGNKLWNVARFSARFLEDDGPASKPPALSPADRWILSRTQQLVQQTTRFMKAYDYAAAKSETEAFFWTELADNYLEMAKMRLYDETNPARQGAQYALYHTLFTVLQLFAPFLPYVTEAIYRGVFAAGASSSIHRTRWPTVDASLQDEQAEALGRILLDIATAVRRYKSEHNLSLGSQIAQLHLATDDQALRRELVAAQTDLGSITRAERILIDTRLDVTVKTIPAEGPVQIGLIE